MSLAGSLQVLAWAAQAKRIIGPCGKKGSRPKRFLPMQAPEVQEGGGRRQAGGYCPKTGNFQEGREGGAASRCI